MRFNLKRTIFIFGTATLSAALLLGSGNAVAKSACLSAFTEKYPNSLTDNNASCQVCHQSAGDPYNGYGWELRMRLAEILQEDPSGSCSNTNLSNGTLAAALGDIEGFDSDLDVSGIFSNLEEINADTQPGWTTGANNTIYFKDGSTTAGQEAPSSIGDLDPSAGNQPPVADANGPYTGTAGVPVQFDGSGSADPDGNIVTYSWDFGDGTNDVGVNPTHTYATTDTFSVTLTVVDDIGAMDSDVTTATIGAQDADGDGVPDSSDNCPLTANLAQLDTDDDGVGNACQKIADISGVGDISGDAVPDIAQLRLSGQPRVRYFSGASRNKIKAVGYLSQAWAGVAAATVVDSNADGTANDPAVAVLAYKASAGKHAVEVRRADNGALINKVVFLSATWDVIDVAVIDDLNGDGSTGDTAIAVLGVNPNKPFNEQIKVQVRKLSNGALLANWFFLNGNWTPLALEGVSRNGASPLLVVLANKAATGANVVQARKLSNGSVQRDTSFLDASWLAQDVSILMDSNGDGTVNDPAYLVLASHPDTGRNKVQARRVSDGKRLKNITMLGTNWRGTRVTSVGDISGNLREEVGVLAEKRTDGTVAIQLKDYADRTTTATIFP
jgi:PKD repeat protein